MIAFIDFEASSLGDKSYPIEVAWIFEDGRSQSHLIKPAQDWTDWSDEAENIHGISRDLLASDGVSHVDVAQAMVESLVGHALYASAPSWDGKWLSVLLRAAGLPRHALRLQDTDVALRDAVTPVLQSIYPPQQLGDAIEQLVAWATATKAANPAHRALADATGELAVWQKAKDRALAIVAAHGAAR